jgi:hypothetical protein
LRYRIFCLIEERQRAGGRGLPTSGEIAEALQAPLRDVVVTLRSSEAMSMVELAEGFGTPDDDISVLLKPQAYIYLESQLNN